MENTDNNKKDSTFKTENELTLDLNDPSIKELIK